METTTQPLSPNPPKRHLWQKVVVSVLIIGILLYFFWESVFINVLVWLLILGIPLGSIVIILSPLWITKRLYRVKRFSTLSVVTALPFIVILTLILWKLDIALFKWLVSQAGKGFFQTF